ncbi:MAG: carboxynorspermidine decarboxylase [Candidatus Aureabacteria bacterium]|nr:carboxynorspermidine decarboxylase [Candidatus Auribacterota bacterium]
MKELDVSQIPTPCYVCEKEKLQKNLAILECVQKESDCKILLALKGFSMFSVFPLLNKVLKGTCASSLYEARLGREEFGGEVHIYAPAYRDDEFDEILSLADHVVFNTFSQWEHFKDRVLESKKRVSCGLRINPEVSEVETEIYNPCCRFSRLGTTKAEFREGSLDGIRGIHFHALCEKNVDALERTLENVEKGFGHLLQKMEWVNFGGGHHITRRDYGVDRLIELILRFKNDYGVDVYLEPGEAVALDAGVLVASVVDTMRNEMDIAIIDASASAHMPDVLEMPYRPQIRGAGIPGDYPFTYRLAGTTCLAGDVIGDYSFEKPLRKGDKIVFEDMLHYTMVKNNTFNGVRLPSIAVWSAEKGCEIVRRFGYEDYKSRLS